MCGICGVYRYQEDAPISAEGLEAMKDMIRHRGPNQEGSYLEPHLGLGHRRLSIIGVSDGRQPISNETGSVWITFNGEIYNYRELKEGLLARGHTFRTKTDTEVIVHLYEEKGADFVHELRGMFAIGIWDKDRRRLILARDRLGKKPLYYRDDGKQILFGSELKCILAYPGVPRSPDEESLHHYLSLGYVPAPRTAFRGISTLPAGHLLEVSRGRAPVVRQYWDVQFRESVRTEAEAMEEVDGAFEEAVRVRLESEVPLGVFLSGGTDSTAVAHRMSRSFQQKLVSTTIRFEDPRFDESTEAAEVAELLGTEHHVHEVGPGSTDIVERILWHFDEPFADASALPTYFLCKTAREQLTVALSGDGGDEMFGGYTRYAELLRQDRLRQAVPGILRKLLLPLQGLYPVNFRGRALLENLNLSFPEAACNSFFYFARRHKADIYSKTFRGYLADTYRTENIFGRFFDACASRDPLSRLQYVDYKSYLVDDICVKVDRMSMAFALEVRAPLLDQKLVELVATYPSSLKLADGVRKRIFKALLKRYLPERVVDRPKRGFGVPLSAWFRKEIKGLFESVLRDGKLAGRGYFEPAYLEKLWSEQQRGSSATSDLGTHCWILLMFELWHRMYIDSDAFRKGPAPSRSELSSATPVGA